MARCRMAGTACTLLDPAIPFDPWEGVIDLFEPEVTVLAALPLQQKREIVLKSAGTLTAW